VLAGNYPNNAGEGLVSPAFFVTPDSDYMEILHYVHVESNFDGCNVSVNGTVIPPTNGYTHTISTSTSYYAYCVNGEPGWSGTGFSGPAQVWLQQCFDLSAFTGQEIQVEFDFGSDSSVSYPGWYLAYVKVGSLEPPIPNDEGTWGRLKSLYR
jgi:bacillopeptidase F